jgi:uncharacterized protein
MIGSFGEVQHNPTSNEIFLDTLTLGNFIKEHKNHDVVIGLSRGGLIPAVILSHYLVKPFIPVVFSGADGNGDDKEQTSLDLLPELDSTKKYLIVDDICDSGDTLTKMVNHYKDKGIIIETAVLYYKDRWPHLSVHDPEHGYVPNYILNRIPEHSGWIVFPWENVPQSIRTHI